MRKRQAPNDPVMAESMGVSGYVPKNVKLDAKVECVGLVFIRYGNSNKSNRTRIEKCDLTATYDVRSVEKDGTEHDEPMCEHHSRNAQVDYYDRTVVVRRRKVA